MFREMRTPMIVRASVLFFYGPWLGAQPTRPELFGYVGVLRAAGDEGSLGSGLLWGGTAVVPIARRVAFDVDIGRAKTERNFPGELFQLRRTFAGFSVIGRWGSAHTYVFAGGGVGIEASNRLSQSGNVLPGFRPPGGREVAPGVFQFTSSDTRPSLVVRGGVVHAIWRNILVRFDLFSSQQHVLPNLGARAALGWRF